MKQPPLWTLMNVLYKSHPWHGVDPGTNAPDRVTAYIESVPSDPVKYEIDKVSGHMKIDRPHDFSSRCPALYGFIPRTLCSRQTAALSGLDLPGDEDPLDICILSEYRNLRADLLVEAIPIGAFSMIDGDEVDDKIIAVLKGDPVHRDLRDIHDCPAAVIDRLRHYFLTYKQDPDSDSRRCSISAVHGPARAREIILCGMEDYRERFGSMETLLNEALNLQREMTG